MAPQKTAIRSRRLSPKAQAAFDSERMRGLVTFASRTLDTPAPVAFAAEIVNTKTGERLVRALNNVAKSKDPSLHAELRAVGLGCRKLGIFSLAGYTLYTTCEPCPMCMANAMWASLDRVVYGLTITEAAKFVRQIHIPATEVEARSDWRCKVDGPCEDQLCLTLFSHPNMLKAFRSWRTRKA
jgi:tRNA(Arg) A34 adenosine deaminase TadA